MKRHNLRGCCFVAQHFRSIRDFAFHLPSQPKKRGRDYHIDRLVSFVIQFQRQWQNARGISAANVRAYLAETEWRFNRPRNCLLDVLYEGLIANEHPG